MTQSYAPIGFTRTGRAVFAIAGGAPEGDGSGDGSGDGKGGDQGKGGEGGAQQQQQTQTFSQADVDRIVSDRLKREQAKLGDLEEIRRKASEFDKLDAASKSDLEKANGKIAELERQIAARDLEMQSARAERALTSALEAAGAIRPATMWKLADLADLEYDEAGAVKNAAKVVEQVRKDNPELFRAANGSGDGGARPRGGSGTDWVRSAMSRGQ